MRERTPLLIALLMLTSLPPMLGCMSNGPGAHTAADSGARVGDAAARDAGASSDAGPAVDADPVPLSPPEGLASGDARDYANDCLDGRDQNEDTTFDCADPSCSAAPSCCVGSSSTACCHGVIAPIELMFGDCTASSCTELDDLTVFGDPGPVVTDGAISPVADGASDSGAISLTEVDPRSSLVSFEASIAIPATTLGIDAVAFGLTASTVVTGRVSPVVAVVVSASRGDVTLQVGGEIVGSFPAPTDGAYHTYNLTLDPTGAVVLTGGVDDRVDAHIVLPARPLHSIVYGRATNPGSTPGTQPARIRSLTVLRSGCDAPTALSRGTMPLAIVDDTSAALLAGATAPNVVTIGTDTLLAFAAPSMAGAPLAIFVATRHADGTFHVENDASVVQPVLAGAIGQALTDPALRDDGDHWTLFATLRSAGTSRLVMSTGGAAHALTFGPLATISVSTLSGDLDSPAPIPGAPSALIARHLSGAASELVLLELTDTASPGAYAPDADICGADDTCLGEEERTSRRIHAARVDTFAFDADEVASPSVVLVNHVYRLYYAGRRGSRWSIGMLIAADLGFWRSTNEGLPVLDADGTGFDAVSVMEPTAVLENGALSIYYVGSNGVDRAIGVSRGSSSGL